MTKSAVERFLTSDKLDPPDEVVMTVHYYQSDVGCRGDYVSVDLSLTWDNGVGCCEARTFGDDYHDKGRVKAEAWIEALKFLYKDMRVMTIEIADYED